MKKISILFVLTLSIFCFSQEKATDLFNLKAGFIGGWIGYEKALSSEITLNGEVGYEGGLYYSSMLGNDLNYIFSTTLSLEGRYYYNFNRRIEKGKNTRNNAANYLGLEATYTPDWGTSSSVDNISILRTFTLIPKYGFRRNISDKFNFEFSVGPGYQWTESRNDGLVLGVDARFGFNF